MRFGMSGGDILLNKSSMMGTRSCMWNHNDMAQSEWHQAGCWIDLANTKALLERNGYMKALMKVNSKNRNTGCYSFSPLTSIEAAG
jgi:hypothetical protein